MTKKIDYKSSGVDINEGNRFVSLIKDSVKQTDVKGVIGGIGGFAGLFDISHFAGMKEPVLVSGTDGVGTKLKIAIDSGIYDTVGIDLVAMSVNDLIVTGAMPLFFLDYLATGKLIPEKMYEVIKGVTAGCIESSCALLGGETAEMPGMYYNNDFDLAGFAVGIVDKPKIIDGSRIKKGDKIIAIQSSGFHSNGYSLLRKVLLDDLKLSLDDHEFIKGKTLAESLLIPTRIYVKLVSRLQSSSIDIKGMVHITGGGFYDNIPRVLPAGTSAYIDKSKIIQPEIYNKFLSITDIEDRELYRVLNMGVGFIIITADKDVKTIIDISNKNDYVAFEIGSIEDGNKEVFIKGIDTI